MVGDVVGDVVGNKDAHGIRDHLVVLCVVRGAVVVMHDLRRGWILGRVLCLLVGTW